jgi:dTDP-4-amino-4,6-dideoxygalactose transaminase
MDPGLLEVELKRCATMGRMPKAVVPTDLYGQCCNYDRIFAVCAPYRIPVIVDAAESVGSRLSLQAQSSSSKTGVHAGCGAKAAVYSFNGNKIMTTSGGGMLASGDKQFIEYARFLSQQARDPFIHYEHSEIGYNYRMSNILAALGRGQLRVLDERVQKKAWRFSTIIKRL